MRRRRGVSVGDFPPTAKSTNWATSQVSADSVLAEFDAVLLTGGSEQSRDYLYQAANLEGVHFAMEVLPQQTASMQVGMP